MSDAGLKVLDGEHLRSPDLPFPDPLTSISGAQFLELAESTASQLLDGLPLPITLKLSGLRRLNLDASNFPESVIKKDQALLLFKDYIAIVTEELRDDPIVVAILDGKVIRILFDDEDDFAMLAENLFTDLDVEEEGKISKGHIRGALQLMKVEMGVPPFSEFHVLNEILKKHGAEGEQKLGQAQFAELLQPVLQDIADALAEKPVIIVQKIKITNGSKLKKLLADEKKVNEVVESIYNCNQTKQGETKSIEAIRSYLEKNGKDLGLPPSEANEALTLLFDTAFPSIDKKKTSATLANKDNLSELLKDILAAFVEQLEVNPVFYDMIEN